MRVHLYTGSLSTVEKSGVGQAILHQRSMLEDAGVQLVEDWSGRADVVQINTVFPRDVLAALRARRRGETVVYYGHSTMQDFRDSFVGSNLLAPLFRRWLCFCYNLGDAVLTPTPYSKKILESYGLKPPIYALSNGVDTDFFAPSAAAGQRFRAKYGLDAAQKVVVSVGHYMERKGILDFIELARAMPQVQFYWFGYTAPALVPARVKDAMAQSPENLHFPGFLAREELRDAYCGADVFCFCSKEETEGIVVLEALACGAPALLREIPVYADWLTDGVNVYKAADGPAFRERLSGMLDGSLPDLSREGRAVAESRSLHRIARRLCALYEAAAAGRAPAEQEL